MKHAPNTASLALAAFALLLLLLLPLIGCTANDKETAPGPRDHTANPGGNPSPSGNETAPGPTGHVSWQHVQTHWVGGNSDPRYPASEWLIGVGISPYVNDQSYEEAGNRGRQELVAFFETQIQSEFRNYQEQITIAERNAPPDVRGETFTRQSLRAIVSGTIAGSEVADRTTDPQRQTAYALVVVNRRIMADNLKVQIDELQARIRATLAQARSQRDVGRYLGALRGYSPIVAWHQQLVALIQQYNLVRPAGYPPISLDFDLQGLLDEIVEVALKLTFAFKIEGRMIPHDGSMPAELDVEGELIRQLRDQGIQVTIMRSTPAFRGVSASAIREMSVEQVRSLLNVEMPVNYVITGTLTAEFSSEREQRGQRLPVYKVTYQLEVIELSTNETIPLADAVGRSLAAGNNAQQAARQAMLFAAQRIAQELAATFAAE